MVFTSPWCCRYSLSSALPINPIQIYMWSWHDGKVDNSLHLLIDSPCSHLARPAARSLTSPMSPMILDSVTMHAPLAGLNTQCSCLSSREKHERGESERVFFYLKPQIYLPDIKPSNKTLQMCETWDLWRHSKTLYPDKPLAKKNSWTKTCGKEMVLKVSAQKGTNTLINS